MGSLGTFIRQTLNLAYMTCVSELKSEGEVDEPLMQDSDGNTLTVRVGV